MTLLLWDILSVKHFADLIYVSIISGKYIFRAKLIKPPSKKIGLVFFTCFYFVSVFLWGGWVF